MKNLSVEIDLTNKITKMDVIHAFENTLQMPISEIANWDGFEDFFTSLDTESHIVKEKK